jgi:UDP-sulfoquinovose synthase
VYGIETDESVLDPRLVTSFHYDEVFGTALNRFCVQAVVGHPLTVYGRGGQTRGYLNIRDTIACVAIAAANPADPGELRVFNQFTEQFSVLELAERVKAAGEHLGWTISIAHTDNPRKELEDHYYNAQHSKLLELGLQPRLLNDELIDTMLDRIAGQRDRIDKATFVQNVRWVPEAMAEAGSTAQASRR